MIDEACAANREYHESEYPHQGLTSRIIAAFFHVHRCRGFGFVEPVYRKTLAVELQYRGIAIAQEVPFELLHRGVPVGFYRADLIAESRVVLEVKTGEKLDPIATIQLRNYLKASRIPIGLVLYFGPKPRVKRVILSRSLGALDEPA